MPKYIPPRKSGPHRIAAIALYRALLVRCDTAQVASEHRSTLRNVIRNKFRSNANLQSTVLLRNAFTAGHEALDHLHFSATGRQESTSYLADLISRLPAHMAKPPPRAQPAPTEKPASRPPLATGWENSALAARPRPLSQLKGGKRNIPVLVSANRIPILRTQKPVSHALSVYIHARVVQRQRRHDRRWELMEAARVAQGEDLWDREIERKLQEARDAEEDGDQAGEEEEQSSTSKLVSGGAREPSWESEIQRALKEVGKSLLREAEKNKSWAAKMVELIDREKETAEKERKERKMMRNQERRDRKLMRDTETAESDKPSSSA
ncbi:hypothetical protein AAFC00_005619 [Neodothiora populina]|uniref:Complex 1 LYR protein domain-containing protein n=1 Tax=Neodothiora populina TaxID=2781224 RepID=A0ABR3PLJ6_9PEZI